MNPTRNIPIQTTGRVSEMTSRFGERRHKRDEIINPMHINNPRNGYENVDDRYNEQIEYRNGRVCILNNKQFRQSLYML